MKNIKYLVVFFSIAVISVSCSKKWEASSNENENNQPQSEINSLNEIKVSKNFNWKTTKEVSLAINSDKKGILKVFNPDKKVVYLQVNHSGQQEEIFKLAIPSYEKSIILELNGKEEEISAQAGNASITF